jgi:uncharacterized repeat protein (TIGR03803 family)
MKKLIIGVTTLLFLGVSSSGSANTGSSSGAVEKILYSFKGGPSDGASPRSDLVLGPDGNFYGTTYSGGTSDNGTVFKISPSGVETVLHLFQGAPNDGSEPWGSLIQGTDGNFYGTTSMGGTSNSGTVFKISPSGEETNLYNVANMGGQYPMANLTMGADGNFYGTTSRGGNGNGIIFRISPKGIATKLYAFAGSDGAVPFGGLIQDKYGNFYGTTLAGGSNYYNVGTVFKMSPSGSATMLYSFQPIHDGTNPMGSLIQGADGNFYGTTSSGGATACCGDGAGTVFKISPSGAETVLYSFQYGNDGATPKGALIQGKDGNFYGTTSLGGNGNGAVFEVSPSGVVTVLYTFQRFNDGANPTGALIQGKDGNFYGTTAGGGAYHHGTVFEIIPQQNSAATLH